MIPESLNVSVLLAVKLFPVVVPDFSVPPFPFKVKDPALTTEVMIAVPLVLVEVTEPVVVNPEMF